MWWPQLVPFLQLVNFAWTGGLEPTSWWRDPISNRNVGGSPESQHLFGLAVDAAGTHDARRQLVERARAVGLVAVDEGSHVHVQAFPRGALAQLGVNFPRE